MRLKYQFVVREIDGQPIAIAVGEDNKKFNGMIRMNRSGAFVFELLQNDVTIDDLITRLIEKYDVTYEVASQNVSEFTKILQEDGLITE